MWIFFLFLDAIGRDVDDCETFTKVADTETDVVGSAGGRVGTVFSELKQMKVSQGSGRGGTTQSDEGGSGKSVRLNRLAMGLEKFRGLNLLPRMIPPRYDMPTRIARVKAKADFFLPMPLSFCL